MKEDDYFIDLEEFDQSLWKSFNESRWKKYRDLYHTHLRKCWGKFPVIDFQDAVFIEEEKKEGYRIEKYELNVSSTGHTLDDFVPLWILIPDTPRAHPAPTVIVHHQHAGQFELGKSEPAGVKGNTDQYFALELVKRGYVSVVFDALGFEERQEEGGERFIFTRLLLYGMTLNGKYCFDTSSVIEFVSHRPYVDSKRIGIMGHSLGGQMALFASIFDPRIKVIASSCGFSRISGHDSILAHHRNHNFALYLPNLLDPEIGLDMHEIIGLIHPRPLIISNGAMDHGFPIEGAAEIHNWLRGLYRSSGDEDKLETLIFPGKHGTPLPVRERMYQFFDKFL